MDTPCFLQDIYPQNLLYAVTIRSPVAKGRLMFIQYPKLPSNYVFITARNIPGENRLEDTAIPILAETVLSYIGEPVALLLGQDRIKLDEYAAQCVVIADEEKPVFSIGEAADDSVLVCREITVGEPDKVFDKSHAVVQGNYNTGIQDHWYAEPAGAITWYENNNVKKNTGTSSEILEGLESNNQEKIMVVRTATQWPDHVKRSVIRALQIDPSSLLVEPTALGMHIDGKLWYPSMIACHAALATKITNKPVRLVLSKEEDFLYSPKRCKTSVSISSAIDENGKILGSHVDISVNLGVHWVNRDEIIDQTCLGTLGFYRFDNLKLTAKAVMANIPPQGPFSGFGIAQGSFAMERHVSQIADETNQDPASWRIISLSKEKGSAMSSSPSGKKPTTELIGAAASMSDYSRKWASYDLLRKDRGGKQAFAEKGESFRGIGIALGYQGNGLLYHSENITNYGIEVTLTKEGFLVINTSLPQCNDDIFSIWKSAAYKILSIEPKMIRVSSLDAPDSGPSCASRNVTVLTKLVERCFLAVRKQRFRDPLPITVRRSVKPLTGALWDGRFTAPEGMLLDTSAFSNPSRAAAVVEVSTDPVENFPRIRGIWMAVDAGRILSLHGARKSLNYGAYQALGWAYTEQIEYINGALTSRQYANYSIPSPADMPPVNITFLHGDSGEPKGLGELPYACIPAAYLQAASQAMDRCFNSIPLKREDILKPIQPADNENVP
jgi:CO/xanthine dehydrogenase Mo-binding subunit